VDPIKSSEKASRISLNHNTR